MAGQLRAAGVEPGDRVSLILPNVPAYPVAFYGTLLAGGVVVPMNPLLKAGEIEYFYEDSGATLQPSCGPTSSTRPARRLPRPARGSSCAGRWARPTASSTPPSRRADPVLEPVERADDDTAVILYTSGTTGKPKGAELTHFNLHRNAERTAADIMEISRGRRHHGLPAALPRLRPHRAGSTPSVQRGCTLTLHPPLRPGQGHRGASARDHVTIFQGVPTMYAAILNHPNADQADTSSLRTCAPAARPCRHEVMKAFEEKFGCQILEGYGLSETSPVASFNMPDKPSASPAPSAAPSPGCEMKLVDLEGNDIPAGEIGEIAIRGENIMKGYWNRPEATAEAIPDGWFRSGDLATVDDEGYFTIVDRKKDMIIRGGMNVYPREVEEVLYTHPDVLEAAVVGVPGRAHGRGGRRRGGAPARRDRDARGRPDLRQGAPRRLQVPPPDLEPRRAAQGPDRQDPAPRGPRPGSLLTTTRSGDTRGGCTRRWFWRIEPDR